MQPDQMPDSYKGGRLLYRWAWVEVQPAMVDPRTGDELAPAVFGARCPEPPLDVFAASAHEIEAVLAGNADVRAHVAASLPEAQGAVATPVENLADLKAAAVDLINARVGELRAQHITVTVGQSATYLEKQDEAARHVAGESGPFPYLSAEAFATGVTLDAVAALVSATAAAWTGTNAELEGRRRGSLVAVESAQTPIEIMKALALLRG